MTGIDIAHANVGEYGRIARIKSQIRYVLLAEIHFDQWIQCDNIVRILNSTRAICSQLKYRGMVAAKVNLAAVDGKHNAIADEF